MKEPPQVLYLIEELKELFEDFVEEVGSSEFEKDYMRNMFASFVEYLGEE